MKKTAVVLALMTLIALPAGIRAQNAAQEPATAKADTASPPDHFYKLNLTVEETNESGKAVNSRTFVATIEATPHFAQSIRTGDRVPVATSENSYQYMDLGVDFDIASVKEVGNGISFRLTANVSSFATPLPSNNGGAQPSGGALSRPVVRQNKWDSGVLIPIGKPTVVFSADDLQGKGKMQVEVTATRID